MNIYSTVVILHILAGIFFTINLIVMQRVVTGIMKGLPSGPIKKGADDFLERKWRPIMSYILILLIATAFYIFTIQYNMIFSKTIYTVKAALGITTLAAVSFNHFYLRHKKRKLNKTEHDSPVAQKIRKISFYIEKSVLSGAVGTVILAVIAHHG